MLKKKYIVMVFIINERGKERKRERDVLILYFSFFVYFVISENSG